MEKRFIIPAVTFLSGLVIWVVALLVIGTGEFVLWQALLLGLITGSLIFFSAFRCRQVGGPLFGIIFRSILLLVLTVLSCFFIGTTSSVALLAMAIATGLLALRKGTVSTT